MASKMMNICECCGKVGEKLPLTPTQLTRTIDDQTQTVTTLDPLAPNWCIACVRDLKKWMDARRRNYSSIEWVTKVQ